MNLVDIAAPSRVMVRFCRMTSVEPRVQLLGGADALPEQSLPVLSLRANYLVLGATVY